MPPSEVERIHPVKQSKNHVDVRKRSRSSQSSRAMKDKISTVQADPSRSLHDQFKLEKSISKSYVDVRHKGEQALGDGLFPLKPLPAFQKRSVEREIKQDELVKHMSNLPQYLQGVERGANPQEKVLNFGVLDWGRLENWKYNQKPVAQSSHMYSPSTSNTSSPFSTVGSSTLSTRSDSVSIPHRKQSPTRGAHGASFSSDYHFTVLKPTRANPAILQDKVKGPKKSLAVKQNPPGTTVSNPRFHSKVNPEKGMKSNANPKVINEVGSSSSSSKGCEVTVSPVGKIKVREGNTQDKERLQESTFTAQQCPGGDATIFLLLPKNLSNKRFSTPSRIREYSSLTGSKQAETGCSSLSDGFGINEVAQFSEFPSSIPQLSRTKPGKPSDLNTPRSVNALGSKAPSDVSVSLPHSGELNALKHMQEENSVNSSPVDLMLVERLRGPGLKAEELFSEPRSARCEIQSPNRRLSFGKAKLCRSLSFKEDSDLPQLSSAYITAKSGPVESFACSDGLNRDKSATNRRNRSSPLRRLLDPLLRPKTANTVTAVESLHDEAQRVCSSSDQQLPASVRPVKLNADFSGSIPDDTSGAHRDEKYGTSMVQALLQVTVKNELPWFTFAVDNNSDILAATMRKTSLTDKYDCSWIYTFYSFRKSKKKSGGWIGYGSKGRGPDYVPNIVGQMKVNGRQSEHNSRGPLTVREFVLFDVEPRKTVEETTNLVSNVELAGVVIKVPIKMAGTLNNSKQESSEHGNISNMKCSNKSVDGSFTGSQNLSSIVVVLPNGVHGVSAARLPSPLLDRWRGGSCDCGGWDVGCQLRVLSNEGQHTKNLGSTKSFDLYFQGGGSRETIPSLRFATFDKGVHSIDFNASMSSLQAFSICIAFLHCKNLANVNNLFQELTVQELLSTEPQRTKLSTQIEGNPPCSVRFPPPSPVRRA